MTRKDKLHVNWSKRERDFMINYPLGYGTKSDGHWLSGVFNREFEAELKERGYDPATLKFEVQPAAGNPKFASQRKEDQTT